MAALRLTVIAHGSDAYREAVELRHEVLRKPLGLNFTPQQLAAEADALHYAAYAGERLVATAYLLPLDPARAHLRQMAVSPGMRASGVGGALLAYLEDDARRRGYREIVADARVSALGFYLKQGYTAHDEVYDHVGLPHRRIHKALIDPKAESTR
ncbi:MAG TPA: GNAT family N-acetyltransferase [Burkholderiales bacterium]|nr:GNAT family N-acetyltransferase [Burkholderiales bacterium]